MMAEEQTEHSSKRLWRSHTLRWDGMGWAALVVQCISVEAFTHKLRCALLRDDGKTLLIFLPAQAKAS